MARSAEIGPAWQEATLREREAAEAPRRRENEEPLLAFRRGDISAFESLFRRHQREVFCWVLRIVRNPAAAEEITIEAFWRIYRAHAQFDPARGFEAWARRIATRAAIDYLRRKRPEVELPLDLPAPARADPAISAEIRCKTGEALARLPAKLRVATRLAVIEDRPQKEVAAALGISVGAVKLRVFRALRMLRKDLEAQGIRP
jgi:RNA polymerase sigma factor (sigma-70 family)